MDLGREIIMVLYAKHLTYREFQGKGYHSCSSPCALLCFPCPLSTQWLTQIATSSYFLDLPDSGDDPVNKVLDSYLFCLAFV